MNIQSRFHSYHNAYTYGGLRSIYSQKQVYFKGQTQETTNLGVQLLREIQEQPTALANLIQQYPKLFQSVILPNQNTRKIWGLAEGSSKHALEIAAPYLSAWSGMDTAIWDPLTLKNQLKILSETNPLAASRLKQTSLLAVSQSGKTSSLVDGLQLARQAAPKMPMLALTNNQRERLGLDQNHHLYLAAGPEQSIAATKSMTNSILMLLLLGLFLGQKQGRLDEATAHRLLQALQNIPKSAAAITDNATLNRDLSQFAQLLTASNQFVLLSNGPMVSVLPEAGLKLTETSSNIVQTFNTESFKHGPKVVLKGINGTPPNSIYLLPPDLTPAEATQFFQDVRAHFYQGSEKLFNSDHVFFIRFENSPNIPNQVLADLNIPQSHILNLPKPANTIASLFSGIITFQLLSAYLAQAKGIDPNNPALQKAVVNP